MDALASRMIGVRPLSRKPPTWPDEVLVGRAISGEPSASRQICVRYASLVRRTLLRVFGASSESHDLAQEVFLRLFQGLRKLRRPAALRYFVMGICLRVARDQIRRKRLRSVMILTPEFDRVPTQGADLDAREAVRRLTRLIEGLGLENRVLFVSRYIDRMEVGEIAAAHEVSLSTAKRRVRRMTRLVSSRVHEDDVLAAYLAPTSRRRAVAKPDRPTRDREHDRKRRVE